MQESQQVNEFLKRYQMHYEQTDVESGLAVFQEQMKAGLKGEPGSLLMLPTYISVDNPVPYDRPIIVVDAGGTNFRVAVVTFQKGEKPLIEQFQKSHMPGTKGDLTAESFFEEIVDRMLPVLDASDSVGFCFSYPMEILPNRDGRLVQFTKEVFVSGVEGALLGENLNRVLANRGLPQKQFVLLNDTVAAMLGGIASHPEGEGGSFLGFIYGTGLNTCYPESTQNIIKAPVAKELCKTMIVNIEAGGFTGFPLGVIDEEYDATTHNPGTFTFEKSTSGAYFGRLIHLVISQACKDGLFSETFATAYHYTDLVPLWEMNDFFEDPRGDNPLARFCPLDEDRLRLLELLKNMLRRSAKLITIHFGAIFQQMGRASSPENPILITAEGTTFAKTPIVREYLAAYSKEILEDRLGHYCRYISVEDVTLLGAAVAGLIG